MVQSKEEGYNPLQQLVLRTDTAPSLIADVQQQR